MVNKARLAMPFGLEFEAVGPTSARGISRSGGARAGAGGVGVG